LPAGRLLQKPGIKQDRAAPRRGFKLCFFLPLFRGAYIRQKAQSRRKDTKMAPQKRTSAKTSATGSRRRKSSAAKKPARLAASAHTATVAHDHHTYTDHRSESYKHYASIMKTVILFLGFVLLLAIIANIFAPSINNRPITQSSSQSFLDTGSNSYRAAATSGGAYKQYRYVTPNGSESSAAGTGGAPASGSK